MAVTCLIVFIIVMSAVINNNIKKIDDKHEYITERAHGQLIKRLQTSTQFLNEFSAYFQNIEDVDYNTFNEYTQSVLEQYPYLHMIHYIVRVDESERESFIARRRDLGQSDFAINKQHKVNPNTFIPSEGAEIYYPFVFTYSLSGSSSRLVGFDGYSSNEIREAIDKSLSSGDSFATAPFIFMEEKPVYIVMQPIVTNGKFPRAVNRGNKSKKDLLAITVNIDELIRDINPGNNYALKLLHLNKSNRIVDAAINNQIVSTGYTLLPLISKTKTLYNSGQSFQITLERQIHWRDLEYGWIAFYFIITIAVLILAFSFVRLRIQSNTERLQAQAALYKEREMAEVTLYSIDEAVITTDTEQIIKLMNPVACLLTGWSENEAIGKPLNQIYNVVDENTHTPIVHTLERCLELECTVRSESPIILIKRDGSELIIDSSSALTRDHNYNTTGAVLVFRNITHVRDLSKKMEFQAKHDALTELINRREFEHKLNLAIKSANEEDKQHALCYMDLDQFKIVNDTCGHIAGDQLLREVSKLMPHTIRASDCLGRLGGDEFGVLMFDCPVYQAEKVAESLRSTIKNFTFKWNRKIFDVGVSIGLVPIHKNSGSLQEIMSRADSACYIAKDLGRNRIHVYTDNDKAIAQRQGEMIWLTEIQSALKEDRFKLYIQAIRPIKNTTDPIHHEILLRMEDRDGKIIPPMSFLPAADRYDMMPKIDRWVIETSLSKISRETKHTKNCIYNINLSGQTLHDKSIVGFIKDKIQQLNIPPEIICFEITETAVISNFTTAIKLINILKDFGCKFALDDFGSGLSSFSYLKNLPVDYLKIDGEFVRDILFDQMDRAILTSICNIGHEMGLKTVAEYVESTGILALCVEIGVDYAQGYTIEKPYPWMPEKVIPMKSRI
jgi:diguanylate cyclase (GGDEF)-like protein/PAS domain S-box-containing protein